MGTNRTHLPRRLLWVLAALMLLCSGCGAKPTKAAATTTFVFIGERYVYRITEGAFSGYVGGKVIEADKLGEKLGAFMVEAGWEQNGEKRSGEALRAEVYAIKGILGEVAAALKFLDKGDAVTTDHYYVILNPQADLTAVSDYVIPDWTPNNPGDE